MKIPIYQLDAFTDKPFGGNPAAVCPLESWLSEAQMQSIAAENNLSETAFFVKEKENEYGLRWFTPEIEIDLCGHATLASAHVIFNILEEVKNSPISFHTKSGELVVKQEGNLLSMNFPSRKPEAPDDIPKILLDGQGLGIRSVDVLKSRDYFVVFEKEEDIKNLQPNFFLLEKIDDALGIIATAPGDEVDFVSRFFAPAAGVNEDPVTGSAHTTLIPYWAEQLGKKQLTAKQLSKREGILFCEDAGDRVHIAGTATVYLEGEINI